LWQLFGHCCYREEKAWNSRGRDIGCAHALGKRGRAEIRSVFGSLGVHSLERVSKFENNPMRDSVNLT
jgi:hypothetical protein